VDYCFTGFSCMRDSAERVLWVCRLSVQKSTGACCTHFLSLLPATQRIFQFHEQLMPYVCSQNSAQWWWKKLFDYTCGGMYLWFLHRQLQLFNEVFLAMEKTKQIQLTLLSDLTNFKQTLVKVRVINLFHKHPKRKFLDTQCWDDLLQIHELFEYMPLILSYGNIAVAEQDFVSGLTTVKLCIPKWKHQL